MSVRRPQPVGRRPGARTVRGSAAAVAPPARAGGGAPVRRLGRAERSASIVAAAARAFAAGGYHTTSMAAVSEAAGVSHLIIYRHFESKEALYAAVLRGAHDELAAGLASPGGSGPLGPGAAVLLALARRDEDTFRVLWRHASREPEFAHLYEQARELLLQATREALAARVPAEHDGWAAKATVGYLVESVLVWIEDGDPRLDSRFVAATEAALRAGVRSWSTRQAG